MESKSPHQFKWCPVCLKVSVSDLMAMSWDTHCLSWLVCVCRVNIHIPTLWKLPSGDAQCSTVSVWAYAIPDQVGLHLGGKWSTQFTLRFNVRNPRNIFPRINTEQKNSLESYWHGRDGLPSPAIYHGGSNSFLRKSGPQTSSISSIWELVRKAEWQAWPLLIIRWFPRTSTFKRHRSNSLF